ncbi:NmrA-domain-containing protein [Phellopilus nigrolimitatus]|nr:NmrA-domain-containing protein [Phellopilus nigrolimitatus]
MSDIKDKPLVAVVGATGAQGGSVVKYLLEDPDSTFRVRALTRNTESPKAKELAASGVEVVKADMDDAQSVKKAFEGVYGVFGVTNYWETMSEETEIRQGKTLVNAALAAEVQHFVWSTLDHTKNPDVSHWNTKADIDDHLKASGVPRTSLYTSFYFENFIAFPAVTPKKSEDGKIVADWPVLITDGPIGGYCVTETGAYVLEALKKPKEWIGKDLRVLSEIFTPRSFVQILREVTGLEIELRETDRTRFEEAKAAMGDLWCNMEWFYIHEGNPNRDPVLTAQINPTRKTARSFIEANKEGFLSLFDS